MIQMETMLDVADNSGAKKAVCVKILGGSRRRYGHVGDIIVASIRKAVPSGTVKEGELVKGVIVRTANPVRREDGSCVRFDRNAIVIIDEDGNPMGTRIFGAIARELRAKKFTRIISLATEVV